VLTTGRTATYFSRPRKEVRPDKSAPGEFTAFLVGAQRSQD